MATACASAEVIESFDGPKSIWRLADADCAARLLAQRRVPDEGRHGGGAERIQLAMGNGSFVHLACPVPRARVIDELKVHLWLRADQPGAQLIARAVLPESRDPRDGQPLRALLRGGAYQNTGSWQLLSLSNTRTLLEREVRLLRRIHGPQVSARGAYIDFVALNAYTGQRIITLWTDDLELQGRVAPIDEGIPEDAPAPQVQLTQAVSGEGRLAVAAAAHVDYSDAAPRLRGDVFLTDKSPAFLRVIEHNGEPLESLASLGFNAALVGDGAAPALQADAHRLGMWLIAPPPVAESVAKGVEGADRVAAWWLGDRLTEERLNAAGQANQRLRRLPAAAIRPTACQPAEALDRYARATDLITLEHPGLAMRASPAVFGEWLRQRTGHVRGAAPFWVALETEAPHEVTSQLAALAETGALSIPPDPLRLRHLAWQCVGAGARGIVFRSRSRLDGEDAASRQRRAALEWINLELRAIEPWAAAGMASALPANPPGVAASMLNADRSKLIIVTRGADSSGAPAAAGPVSLTVAGVPVSAQPHHVTPWGLRTLRQWLGTGTLRVVLDDPAEVGLVLVSEDPLAARRLDAWMRQHARRVAALRTELLGRQIEAAAEAQSALGLHGEGAVAALADARAALRRSQLLFDTADPAGSLSASEGATASLRVVESHIWQTLGGAALARAGSPCLAAMETLRWKQALEGKMAGGQWSPSLIPAGNFESLERLQESGWRQSRADQANVALKVDLSPQEPRSGQYSLRVSADGAGARLAHDAHLVRIASPKAMIRRSQAVRISFWVRGSPTSGGGTLLIVRDDFGGQAQELEIGATEGWRNFVLYRVAPGDAPLGVEFALCGLGEAWIDDLTVTALESAPAVSERPADAASR